MNGDYSDSGNEYTTMDLYLAGFLAMNGISPAMRLSQGRVVCVFPVSEALEASISLYGNGQTTVKVTEFVKMVKTLRSKIHAFKDKREGREVVNR